MTGWQYSHLKRAIDIVSALVLGILSLPICVMTAIAIKLESPDGPIFADIPLRMGRNGLRFRLYKFRSMIPNAHALLRTDPKFKQLFEEYKKSSFKLHNDPRVTKIGKLIRKYSIDEIPQFINVLKGDMSIVGPRPEVPYYIDKMTDEERAAILSVVPGITDFASIWNSCEEEILRGAADPDQVYQEKIWPEKKRLQIKYVNEQSFLTDLKIIWKTFLKLLR